MLTQRYKLPINALHFLIPLFLSFAMSGIVSCISTLRAVGFENFVFSSYLLSWLFSWSVAFPSTLILLPIAKRMAMLFVQPATE